MQNTATKPVEVGNLLAKESRRRRSSESPYPVKYTLQLSNADVWNNMFIVQAWGRLTTYDFQTPPKMVLDLGCGNGYWVIEAAKQWTDTHFVGFDLENIQPRLSMIDSHKGLRSRISWVHGNMLEGLPFAPQLFDYVRVLGLDMAVPEDEYQPALEEIYRVLKPGGVFEVVTEDLTFPTGPQPFLEPEPVIKSPLVAAYPSTDSLSSTDTLTSLDDIPTLDSATYTESLSSSSISIDTLPSTTGHSSDQYTLMNGSFRSSITQSDRSSQRKRKNTATTTTSSFTVERQSSVYGTFRSSQEPWQYSPESSLRKKQSHIHVPDGYPSGRKSDSALPADSPLTPEAHPQDHSRLKAAWDSMISKRFLALHATTVMPFYINNVFSTVDALPILEIPIPPNSIDCNRTTSGRRSSDSREVVRIKGAPVGFNAKREIPPGEPERLIYPPDTSKRPGPPNTAHLCKSMHNVLACKEPVWLEYRELYKEEAPPVRPSRQFGQDDALRDSFEVAWENWKSDMADRIGMRTTMIEMLKWAEPIDSKPEIEAWRKNLETYYKSREDEGLPLPKYNDHTPPCRTLRAFIAHKEKSPVPDQ